MPVPQPVNPGRRQFLKTGVAGSLVLGFASVTATLGGCAGRSDAPCRDCRWLTSHDRILLTALIPVMLAGALPASENKLNAAIDQVVKSFDFTVAHFSPAIRKEIRQLLDLLEFPLTRVLLTGVVSRWETEGVSGIQSFLSRWENSRFSLFRSGYSALHDLISGAWYVSPESWERIGYAGPPRLVRS
jgi:hypothetical protein